MFYENYDFNQPLGDWNLANGIIFGYMFRDARAFKDLDAHRFELRLQPLHQLVRPKVRIHLVVPRARGCSRHNRGLARLHLRTADTLRTEPELLQPLVALHVRVHPRLRLVDEVRPAVFPLAINLLLLEQVAVQRH